MGAGLAPTPMHGDIAGVGMIASRGICVRQNFKREGGVRQEQVCALWNSACGTSDVRRRLAQQALAITTGAGLSVRRRQMMPSAQCFVECRDCVCFCVCVCVGVRSHLRGLMVQAQFEDRVFALGAGRAGAEPSPRVCTARIDWAPCIPLGWGAPFVAQLSAIAKGTHDNGIGAFLACSCALAGGVSMRCRLCA